MDRLIRCLVAQCGLGLMILASTGCRSLKSEVPPRPTFSAPEGPSAPVSFGSDPSPVQVPAANFSSDGPSNALGSPYGAPPPTSNGDLMPGQMPVQNGGGLPPQGQPGMMGAPGASPSPL
ncbi:MAG: hypothetical protein ABI353_10080 [Isosphaeraceae bacterium]